ncbi:hypothetical protein [Anaerolentibacter hominis]|uniref:hypothetical protein n=1 Tax=Anaerolentibacter hominis TaxID=3079009 RepID=UPI0031B88BF6
MKKERNQLAEFIIGIALFAVGAFWLMSSVTVTTGFYSWGFGGFRVGGLVIVPFVAGIIWLFVNHESMGAKLLAGVGFLIIIASIIFGTRFYFMSRSLYEYLLMVVFIFGGLALILKVLLAKPKSQDQEDDVRQLKQDYNKVEKELEELKKKLK